MIRTIDLVYFNAGGGHRAAATALETVIRAQDRPWQVRLVNLMKVLDPKDVFRKTTGMDWEDIYNTRLARSWSVGLAQELKLLQAAIRMSRRSMASRLRRHWRKSRPDLVVSLIPHFNRPMYEAAASLSVPYVTLLTDFADYPPHFWIEPRQVQHFICGTPKAAAQARAQGYGADRVHMTSGMIIRPDFYTEAKIDRRAELTKLNLDPDRPTGLVMFGGHGSRAMQGIARRLDDVQLIMICGHNAALAQRLAVMTAQARAPRVVLGFTSQMRHYMQLADFFIGKPGPGSISEAVQQGLPVVVVRNTWTMPQERYNTDWVLENGAGIVLESFRFVDEGVRSIIGRLDAFKANLARIENRAVFEIPQILERILESPAVHGALPAEPARTSTLVH